MLFLLIKNSSMARTIVPKGERLLITKQGKNFPVDSGVTINNLVVDINYDITSKLTTASKSKLIEVIANGNGRSVTLGAKPLVDEHNYFKVNIKDISTIWKVESLLIKVVGVDCYVLVEINTLFVESNNPTTLNYIKAFKSVKATNPIGQWHIGYSESGGVPNDRPGALYCNVENYKMAVDIFEYFIDDGYKEIPFTGVFDHATYVNTHL